MIRARDLTVLVVTLVTACEKPPPAPLRYVEVTGPSGIDFHHVHGGSGEMYFVETNGSGATFFDHDNDGDLDLYAVQAGALPGFAGEGPYPNHLYRNDGDLRFADVTRSAKVGDEGYGMGAVAADHDGDGWRDLFVYNWGANVLYRNLGDGTFEDVTAAAGLQGDAYSGTALFADFDRDGDLDLFVGNYVDYDLDQHEPCARPPFEKSYCSPDTYPAQADVLYRNNGNGTFEPAGADTGVTRADGRALGSLAFDLDMDGDLDLAVANDGSANHLYRNDADPGQLKFTDVSADSGFALDGEGLAQGSTGITAADVDFNMRFDVLVTKSAGESNALYVAGKDGTFQEQVDRSGMGALSLQDFGWGTRFFDHDKDGDPDLLVINGHLHEHGQLYQGSPEHAQPPRLFENDGKGSFQEISSGAGPFFAQRIIGRGLAMADLDDDGDLDFFVSANNGPAALVECQGDSPHPWVGVRLVGEAPNRDAIGALVRVHAQGRVQMQEVRAGGSFASQHDLRLVFGLGQSRWPERVVVRWPDGATESFGRPAPGQYHRLVKGEGLLLTGE